MEIYHRADTHLFCGHWNGSPVEIGLTGVMKSVPRGEVYHHHDYHEYYVILRIPHRQVAICLKSETCAPRYAAAPNESG